MWEAERVGDGNCNTLRYCSVRAWNPFTLMIRLEACGDVSCGSAGDVMRCHGEVLSSTSVFSISRAREGGGLARLF